MVAPQVVPVVEGEHVWSTRTTGARWSTNVYSSCLTELAYQAMSVSRFGAVDPPCPKSGATTTTIITINITFDVFCDAELHTYY